MPFIALFVLAGIVWFVIWVISTVAKGIKHESAKSQHPVVERHAKIIGKNTGLQAEGRGTTTKYYITLQTDDGERVAMELTQGGVFLTPDAQRYMSLMPGDEGILRTQMGEILEFRPNSKGAMVG